MVLLIIENPYFYYNSIDQLGIIDLDYENSEYTILKCEDIEISTKKYILFFDFDLKREIKI